MNHLGGPTNQGSVSGDILDIFHAHMSAENISVPVASKKKKKFDSVGKAPFKTPFLPVQWHHFWRVKLLHGQIKTVAGRQWFLNPCIIVYWHNLVLCIRSEKH